MLAYEVEERGQIRWEQQCRPTPSCEYFPHMSGFGLNASTPWKATEANRPAGSHQPCSLSVFASEASRTTGRARTQ
jgi:hypothetical protein